MRVCVCVCVCVLMPCGNVRVLCPLELNSVEEDGDSTYCSIEHLICFRNSTSFFTHTL